MTNEIIRTKASAKNINIAFAWFIVLWMVVFGSAYSFFTPDSEYDICIDKYNKEVEWVTKLNKDSMNACENNFGDDPIAYRDCMSSSITNLPIVNCINKGTWVVNKDDTKIDKITLRDKFWLWDCRFINDSHRLGKYNLEWMAYDIACEKGKSFEVKSPWEYTIEKIGFWYNIGNFIILKKSSEVWYEETRIVLGHTKTSRNVWDKIGEWDVIGQTNVSGASTWMHIHIELWDWYNNVSREFALGEKYKSLNWTALLNHRKWDFGQQNKEVYYFTHYDLWDVKQNDSTPCIGASGKDLCYLEKQGIRTMALTSDVRKNLSVEFGDRVKLTWDIWCEGIYQVEDEMNKRYRETPWVLRPNTPYYIKGDLPSMDGWVCSVTKL